MINVMLNLQPSLKHSPNQITITFAAHFKIE